MNGGIFAGIGLLAGVVLPPIFLAQAVLDGQTIVGALRALGAAFLTLGTVTLLMAVLVPEIERVAPRNAPVWEWWMEFVGGALGAALFGVPATLILPLMAFLYIDRPNWAFPDPEATFWPQGYFGFLFHGPGAHHAGFAHLSRQDLLQAAPPLEALAVQVLFRARLQ